MELVIDTATAACSVALLGGAAVLGERHAVVGRGHAERLVPEIGDLLAEVGGACSGILVDCGPGSFTGVRVGLAAARALGLGWSVPVRGYSAMSVIAAATFDGDPAIDSLCVALIGGHGELFVQRFAVRPFVAMTELASATPQDAAKVVPEALVVGSGAAQLVAARGWGEAREHLPRAADTRLLAAPWRALVPVPIYGRAPDAKVPAA